MSQSVRHSLYESVTNQVVGQVIALSILYIAYDSTMIQNLTVSMVMLGLSIARGYVIRRIFNHYD